jgi:hypothetical protein
VAAVSAAGTAFVRTGDSAVADEEEEPDMRRVEPWWTSLPAGNMKRRSCQGGEDMMGG